MYKLHTFFFIISWTEQKVFPKVSLILLKDILRVLNY